MNALLKEERENDPKYLNCVCPVCNKKFHLKPYALSKDDTHCCSKECLKEVKRQKMSGENNHQFGLRGSLNATWKSDEKRNSYGYKLIRVEGHPFANTDGFVFEHRLIAEKYLLNEENSIEIDGKRYLRQDYVVHHIDENKKNNSIENLMVMTKGDHIKLHNTKRGNKNKEMEILTA